MLGPCLAPEVVDQCGEAPVQLCVTRGVVVGEGGSGVFLSCPGIEALYSGVAIRT
ncbi:hypothetical protein GCM10010341_87060 [Streptomyces noursei]|nr:hypothetical protein GCM10010341_87060 [Streptomyces noursei]